MPRLQIDTFQLSSKPKTHKTLQYVWNRDQNFLGSILTPGSCKGMWRPLENLSYFFSGEVATDSMVQPPFGLHHDPRCLPPKSWEGRKSTEDRKDYLGHSVVTLSLPSPSGLLSSANFLQFHLALRYVLIDTYILILASFWSRNTGNPEL